RRTTLPARASPTSAQRALRYCWRCRWSRGGVEPAALGLRTRQLASLELRMWGGHGVTTRGGRANDFRETSTSHVSIIGRRRFTRGARLIFRGMGTGETGRIHRDRGTAVECCPFEKAAPILSYLLRTH